MAPKKDANGKNAKQGSEVRSRKPRTPVVTGLAPVAPPPSQHPLKQPRRALTPEYVSLHVVIFTTSLLFPIQRLIIDWSAAMIQYGIRLVDPLLKFLPAQQAKTVSDFSGVLAYYRAFSRAATLGPIVSMATIWALRNTDSTVLYVLGVLSWVCRLWYYITEELWVYFLQGHHSNISASKVSDLNSAIWWYWAVIHLAFVAYPSVFLGEAWHIPNLVIAAADLVVAYTFLPVYTPEVSLTARRWFMDRKYLGQAWQMGLAGVITFGASLLLYFGFI